MKKHFTLLILAMLSAGIEVRLAHAAPGDIYSLGALSLLGGQSSGEFGNSYGYSVNDAGQVAGYSFSNTLNDNAAHAFRYSGSPGAGGAMADLGALGGTYTLFRSAGNAINNAGQIAGWSTSSDGVNVLAFRYTGTPGLDGAMINLGALGGKTGSVGVGINDAGQVAGHSSTAAADDPDTRAFLYTGTPGAGGAMFDLGTLGGAESFASAINNVGQVAGFSETATFQARHAFLYTGAPGAGGAMLDLGTLGGPESFASAINNSGQIAGSSNTTGNNATHAFRYGGTPGSGCAMIDLGTLGGDYSHGIGINDAGFVVGIAQGAAPDQGGATLWRTDAANTAIDLDAWLDAINPTLGAYWTLHEARDINNNGLITGYGSYNDGPGGLDDGNRAFILDASSLVVPEPASLALLAFALPLLVGRNVRRNGSGVTRGARGPMTV